MVISLKMNVLIGSLCILLIYGTAMGSNQNSRHKRNLVLQYDWPEPDSAVTSFPHESKCHYFYKLDTDGSYAIHKCPKAMIFDYASHKCAHKKSAVCWSHHFMKNRRHGGHEGKIVDHFRCPFVWRKYPDIKDCTKYYTCLPNKVRHDTCPQELPYFDKISSKCLSVSQAECADETDVPEKDYKCPPSWGSFVYSKNCSKYYECFGKEPTLRTCPRGTLFDAEGGECFPQENVQCDTRFNPYGIKTSDDPANVISFSTVPHESTSHSDPETSASPSFTDKSTSRTDPETTVANS